MNADEAHRIYQLEKSVHQGRSGDGESRPLISSEAPEEAFSRALGVELEKICSFYVAKEGELLDEVNQLLMDIGEHGAVGGSNDALRPVTSEDRHRANAQARRSSSNGLISDDDVEDSASDDDEMTGLNRPRRSSLGRRRTIAGSGHQGDMTASSEFGRSLRRHSTTIDDYNDQSVMFSSGLYSSGILLKKRIISLYVQLCELKSYAQLNRTGFRKVLKKFDKILDKELKSEYISTHVDTAYPFRDETKKVLEENIEKMEAAYTDVVTGGDGELAKKDLRSHLREHVVWERNTVWRDLIGIERRGEAARLGQSLLGQDPNASVKRLQGDEIAGLEGKKIATPIGRLSLPRWLANTSMFTLLVSITVFFLLLFLPIMENPEQQNCLALLVFVSLMWATEVSFRASTIFRTKLTSTDHTALCDFASHPLPLCPSKCCSRRRPRQAAEASEFQGRNLCYLRSNVDARHHVATRWIHPRSSTVKVQNRQALGDTGSQQGRYAAQDCACCQHVRGSVCIHANQQRRGACALLFHHRAHVAYSAIGFEHVEGCNHRHCPRIEYRRHALTHCVAAECCGYGHHAA